MIGIRVEDMDRASVGDLTSSRHTIYINLIKIQRWKASD
jgi:hypothetical protein